MASFGRLVRREEFDELDLGASRFSDLLEFLASQHVTQWSICELLSRLAYDPEHVGASQEAAAALDYLTEHLPLHVATEEQHLFALLRRRAIPGDDVEAMFELLRSGHHDSRLLAEDLVEGLHDIIIGRRVRDPATFMATTNAFCYHQRALIEWEDSVVFPFARQRLQSQDLFNVASGIARGHRPDQFGPWSQEAEAVLGRHATGTIDLGVARTRSKLHRKNS